MVGKRFRSLDIQSIAAVPGPGPIYHARTIETNQAALVYTLQPVHALDARAVQEFYRRQRAASILGKHPRSWHLLESGSHEGVAYFALAGPPGEPLASHLQEWGPSTPTLQHSGPGSAGSSISGVHEGQISSWAIRNWLSDLAWALDYAHQQGLILGNLSPRTVWISCDQSAMVMDPGTGGDPAWELEVGGAPQEQGGSDARFLAPEQVMGRAVGPHTDIYGLGIILFWLLGGEFSPRPHREAARIGRYLPLLPLGRKVDPRLAAICEKATAVSPSNRYRSADLLRAALAENAEELLAARQRSGHAARSTMIRSATSRLEPDESRAAKAKTIKTAGSRRVQWWQEWW